LIVRQLGEGVSHTELFLVVPVGGLEPRRLIRIKRNVPATAPGIVADGVAQSGKKICAHIGDPAKIPVLEQAEKDLVHRVLRAAAIACACDAEQEQRCSMLAVPGFHHASVVR
jgi:hypothetical protein